MQGQIKECLRCNTTHIDDFRACPMVKAIEINLVGQITRVEFMTPVDFPANRSPVDEPEQEYPKLKTSEDLAAEGLSGYKKPGA